MASLIFSRSLRCQALVASVLIALAAPATAAGWQPFAKGHEGLVVTVQAVPNLQQRNCQTLRNCRFTKGGSFRGCVSSYSCRSCYFVPSKCSVGSVSTNCQRQVCDWGA